MEDLIFIVFVGNDGVNEWDYLGLTNLPGSSKGECRRRCRVESGSIEKRHECFKRCETNPDHNNSRVPLGYLCKRTKMPKDCCESTWEEKYLPGFKHHYLKDRDGETYSFPWGPDGSPTHDSTKCYVITVEAGEGITMKKFWDCVKSLDWSNVDGTYATFNNNCQDFAADAIIKCGGGKVKTGY